MLGREPVVDADDARAGLVGQRAADGVDGLEVAQHPAAAVQVGDRPARVLGRVDPDGDAARGVSLDVRDRRPLPRQPPVSVRCARRA